MRTLQYVTLTTLDIAYSVNHLCQHMQTPTTAHWTAAKRVLRYLKGSVDLGLFYSNAGISLNAFCDSGRAGNLDDRKYSSGFGVFLGQSLISWSVKKQNVGSQSNTEVEYHSMALATSKLFWLRMLLCEF